jgi:hypothetical protein
MIEYFRLNIEYLRSASGASIIKKNYPVKWKEQVVLVVGAASSRDHLISRLEAAPTGGFFMVTWTLRISAKNYYNNDGAKRHPQIFNFQSSIPA